MLPFSLRLLLLFVVCKAAIPNDLTNFDNEYECSLDVRLAKPQTLDDVVASVKSHDHVMAVGVGHSYNGFLCAKPPSKDEDSVNIIMTSVQPQTVEVNEEEMTAWVSAGMTIWDMVVQLGDYVTSSAPKGYAIGMPAFYHNQTIGGAVATATHGCSWEYGSLSNQVAGFKVILANGTRLEITPESHPLYFKAFAVNVGRLGVVTHVKMRIIKEQLMRRILKFNVPEDEIFDDIAKAQEAFKSTGAAPEWSNAMMMWDWYNRQVREEWGS